jgi:hypothetical protein
MVDEPPENGVLTDYDCQVPDPDGTTAFILSKTPHGSISEPGKRMSVVGHRRCTHPADLPNQFIGSERAVGKREATISYTLARWQNPNTPARSLSPPSRLLGNWSRGLINRKLGQRDRSLPNSTLGLLEGELPNRTVGQMDRSLPERDCA